MSTIDDLLNNIVEAENMLGRSLPYGPYEGDAIEAMQELEELRAATPDPQALTERTEIADGLADILEHLEANPDDDALWTKRSTSASAGANSPRCPTSSRPAVPRLHYSTNIEPTRRRPRRRTGEP